MNKVMLMGRLTKEVEYRTGNTPVAKFTLAVDRKYKSDVQSADFPNIVAFGKIADFVNKYFHKGMKVVVIGRLQTGSYTKQDGSKVYTTDVVAEDVDFAESKAKEADKGEDFIDVPTGIGDSLPFK